MDNTQFSTAVVLLNVRSQMGSQIASTAIAADSLILKEGEDRPIDAQVTVFPGGLLVRVLVDGIPAATPQVIVGNFNPSEVFMVEAQLHMVTHSPTPGQGNEN